MLEMLSSIVAEEDEIVVAEDVLVIKLLRVDVN